MERRHARPVGRGRGLVPDAISAAGSNIRRHRCERPREPPRSIGDARDLKRGRTRRRSRFPGHHVARDRHPPRHHPEAGDRAHAHVIGRGVLDRRDVTDRDGRRRQDAVVVGLGGLLPRELVVGDARIRRRGPRRLDARDDRAFGELEDLRVAAREHERRRRADAERVREIGIRRRIDLGLVGAGCPVVDRGRGLAQIEVDAERAVAVDREAQSGDLKWFRTPSHARVRDRDDVARHEPICSQLRR